MATSTLTTKYTYRSLSAQRHSICNMLQFFSLPVGLWSFTVNIISTFLDRICFRFHSIVTQRTLCISDYSITESGALAENNMSINPAAKLNSAERLVFTTSTDYTKPVFHKILLSNPTKSLLLSYLHGEGSSLRSLQSHSLSLNTVIFAKPNDFLSYSKHFDSSTYPERYDFI
jgi:hypothetical protein